MKMNPKIGPEVLGKNYFVQEKGQGNFFDFLLEYLPLNFGEFFFIVPVRLFKTRGIFLWETIHYVNVLMS